ncbi:hypothetical protein, partial [Streptomyces jumonjinensis]|uniref:hypothetical protein n=1 Tax=Streptomyces jumonjinensis TaxID=1945 RepID=UPI0037906E88
MYEEDEEEIPWERLHPQTQEDLRQIWLSKSIPSMGTEELKEACHRLATSPIEEHRERSKALEYEVNVRERQSRLVEPPGWEGGAGAERTPGTRAPDGAHPIRRLTGS